MMNVQIEFWMWMGDELGPDFEAASQMRARLKTAVEDGTTCRQLFVQLAERYPAIKEKIFPTDEFHHYVVATLNQIGLDRDEFYDSVLHDGDVVTVLPVYVGG